eukprot:2635590-Rhodomonas_salina.1
MVPAGLLPRTAPYCPAAYYYYHYPLLSSRAVQRLVLVAVVPGLLDGEEGVDVGLAQHRPPDAACRRRL